MCSYTEGKELGARRGLEELRVWRSGDPITEAESSHMLIKPAVREFLNFNDIHT